MTANLSFTLTDSYNNVSACKVKIYNPDGTTMTKTGTMNASGLVRSCYVNLSAGDISGYGHFILEPWANDTLGNSGYGTNQSNWTIVYLQAGWNLLQVDRNCTLGTFNLTGTVSKISKYSNQHKNYTTWIKGTATNENVSLTDGDAVYVYSTSSSYWIRYWGADVSSRNITMYDGWNQMMAFNRSGLTLEQICNEPIENATAAIKYVSYHNSRSGLYQSHRCGFHINENVTVPKGYGYWINVENQTAQIRNRD